MYNNMGMFMIFGIGIDILEIKRIENAVRKNPRFISRLFTNAEIEILSKKKNYYESLAGMFCAKEAFSKAIGTGFGIIKWREIEILRDDLGKPYIKLLGSTKDYFEKKCFGKIHLTISHSNENAVANCIIEV
jgi:holo-[acyl-carrier protein] synthase